MEKPAVDKKEYEPPKLKEWGTLAELTQTGLSYEGGDAKIGSVPYSQGR